MNTTLVTGIWDLGRDKLSPGWGRNFDHYISNFKILLSNLKDINFIIFIDPELEHIVWECRNKSNTVVYHHKKEQFSGDFFPFFDDVQEIRTSEEWLSQAGWLKDSTQAVMEWYNPMVMSKMFLLHNAKVYNPFNSEFMFWIDGGLTNTVHYGYFTVDSILEKITENLNNFLFICFPYETVSEIHGFAISEMNRIAQAEVKRVARGGFFGGKCEYISKANELYYNLLKNSIKNGFMGTEESIFTLMTYVDPESYSHEMINSDGLISTFFENTKNSQTKIQQKSKARLHKNNNISLYINAFNSPEQLQMVLDSFEKYDTNFISKTQKYLINNTTKSNLFPKYESICSKYGIEEIRNGNLGVCRARQFSAEHFSKSGNKYMLFFEDDMLLDYSEEKCNFGFPKPVKDLFNNLVHIMNKEDYDFIKLSFSEFYGHNGEQWSWHNVPEPRKTEYFGSTNNRPLTKFNNIKTLNSIPYCDGEIYYSNWPHIISQEGTKKLFLDTTWANPFEQTWMSHIYTLTREHKAQTAILLASPITHNRVHFYEASERKEN